MTQRIRGAWGRSSLGPLAVMLVIAHAVFLGPFLASPGMPRGTDMAVNMVTGYGAENNTWHEIWDDSRAPSQVKHVSRFALADLGLTSLVELTGDVFLSIRLFVWALHVVAMTGMFLYVRRVTGSDLAGVLAGLAYVFSRGAPLRAITAMMAGFALLPWAFLAVDRFLEKVDLRRTLTMAVVVALFVTASIPPFTYIAALGLITYLAAFGVSRLAAYVRRRRAGAAPGLLQAAAPVARTSLFGALAVVVVVALSAYFVYGLARSTAPLVEDAGGYSLEGLQSGRPSFVESLLMYRGDDELNPAVINVAIWLVFGVAVAAPFLKFGWREVALLLVGLQGVWFAADATSPVYRLMYDHVPFFSSVRGTRRWTALALFGFTTAAAVTFAVAKARLTLALQEGMSWRSVRWRLVSAAAAFAGFALVFSVASQLQAVWGWLRPYQLTEEYVAPYEELRDFPAGTVYATSPFLTKRLSDDTYESGVANGKQAGPAISGRPAFGVFQSGGKDVNTTTFDLVKAMKGYPNEQFTDLALTSEAVSLSARPGRGPRSVRSFVFFGALNVRGVSGDDSYVRVQFHRVAALPSPGNHAFHLYPATGLVELRREVGGEVTVLGSAQLRRTAVRNFQIELTMQDDQFEATVNGVQAMLVSVPRATGADVLASSNGVSGEFRSLELSVGVDDIEPDYALMKLLGLLNVEYFVVQPNTTQFERGRLAALPGLRELETWGASGLYSNDYYSGGKTYFSPDYGVYIGDPVEVAHGLYQLDSIARANVPLIGLLDVPEELRAEVVENAAFVVVQGNQASDEASAPLPEIVADAEGVALGYTWDLSTPDTVLSQANEAIEDLTLTTAPVELGRGKNFVMQATVEPQGESLTPGRFVLEFRIRGENQSYRAVVDGRNGLARLEHLSGANTEQLAEARVGTTGRSYEVRVAAQDQRLVLMVNGRAALDIEDTQIQRGGPLLVSSDQQGAGLTSVRLIAGDETLGGLEPLISRGFDIEAVARAVAGGPSVTRAVTGFEKLFSTELPAARPGRYRLLLAGLGAAAPELELWLEGQSRQPRTELNPAGYGIREWSAPPGLSNWVAVTDAFVLSGQRPHVAVASSSDTASLSLMMLIESDRADPLDDNLDVFLAPEESQAVTNDRLTASSYRGFIERDEPGVVVFAETYHRGWRARSGGEDLPHMKAFGTMNAFWSPAQDAGGVSDLSMTFALQHPYRRAQMASLGAAVIVAFALGGPLAWRRVRRLATARPRGGRAPGARQGLVKRLRGALPL